MEKRGSLNDFVLSDSLSFSVNAHRLKQQTVGAGWSTRNRSGRVGRIPPADQQVRFSSLDPRGGSHPEAHSEVALQELEAVGLW